jgi:hypothetical protein
MKTPTDEKTAFRGGLAIGVFIGLIIPLLYNHIVYLSHLSPHEHWGLWSDNVNYACDVYYTGRLPECPSE